MTLTENSFYLITENIHWVLCHYHYIQFLLLLKFSTALFCRLLCLSISVTLALPTKTQGYKSLIFS